MAADTTRGKCLCPRDAWALSCPLYAFLLTCFLAYWFAFFLMWSERPTGTDWVAAASDGYGNKHSRQRKHGATPTANPSEDPSSCAQQRGRLAGSCQAQFRHVPETASPSLVRGTATSGP